MLGAPKLDLSTQGALALTPQLQQSLKILQMSYDDLAAYLQNEADQNPYIEFEQKDLVPSGLSGNTSPSLFYEETAHASIDGNEREWEAPPPTLHQHLLDQLHQTTDDPKTLILGKLLIDHIDPAGYLDTPLQTLANDWMVDTSMLQNTLHIIQRFDPPGVGARNLAECLTIQLKDLGLWDNTFQIILDHLPWVAKRDWKLLVRACNVDESCVRKSVDILKELTPKPGSSYTADYTLTRRPDIRVVRNEDGILHIHLNDTLSLRLGITRDDYRETLKKIPDKDSKSQVRGFYHHAAWVSKTVQQRHATVLRVAESIVALQKNFFDRGVSGLKPLTLRDVATDIGMHESTVSRVVMHKSMETPMGILDFKYFFNASLGGVFGTHHATESVRSLIKELINKENVATPLSDDDISKILLARGIKVARRTVSKYREALNIPSSHSRRML